MGNYPVTITATASGVPQQTLTLPVQVTPASQGGGDHVQLRKLRELQKPRSGSRSRAEPVHGRASRRRTTRSRFTPGATGRGGLRDTRRPDEPDTQVLYASATELTSLAIAGSAATARQPGTKRLTGTFVNTGIISQAAGRVMIGGADIHEDLGLHPGLSRSRTRQRGHPRSD